MSVLPNYYLPGEYIGDMHYGPAHIINRIRERLGEDQYLEFKTVQVVILSGPQREAMEKFLDATRALFSRSDSYLNKMLVVVGEGTAMYQYDNDYFGIVTF